MTEARSPWGVLGLDRDVSVSDVRRRYAVLIKEYRPDEHPEDFARIREAYDIVLNVARNRQAQDGAAAAPADALPAPRPEAAEVQPSANEPDAKEDLAAAAREVYERAQAEGELVALGLLRALLAKSRSTSLDDRQTLEFVLLRWFLQTDTPPLLLMFEAGRAFAWHGQEDRVAGWIGSGPAQRLAVMLALSRDEVFARFFAGNRWLHRLFTPGAKVPWLGAATPMDEARAWELRWRSIAAHAPMPSLPARLDGLVSRRLAGRAVLATDVLVALLVSLFFAIPLGEQFPNTAGPVRVLLLGVLGGPVLAGLRIAASRARAYATGPLDTRLGRTVRWIVAHQRISLVMALGTGFGLFTISTGIQADMPLTSSTIGWVLITITAAAFSGFVLWALWWFMLVFERVAFTPFEWREAVDRLEFQRLMRSSVGGDVPDSRRPFGATQAWWRRLKLVREALALENDELKRHVRPPRAPLPGLVRPAEMPQPAASAEPSWSKPRKLEFRWWWIVVAIGVVRVLSTLGS